VSTTITRHPAPSSCKKEVTVFARTKRTADPANSMHTSTNASRAISKVAFIMLTYRWQRLPLFELACVRVRFNHVARFIVKADDSIV
jgi:hypothetical protein